MSALRLYAVTDAGPVSLPIPAGASTFTDLYVDLPLGVYSALRTFEHNKFLCLDEHLARTRRSMQALGWKPEFDEQRLRRALHEVVTAYPAQDSRVRFDILAAPAMSLGSASRELIALMPFTPIAAEVYQQGVRVEYAQKLKRRNPLAKTADFPEQRQRYLAGQGGEAYEYLLLDEAGYILEGTRTNFWAVRDGTIYTAPDNVLEGVTRKILLALIGDLRIPLRLEAIHRDAVASLDEAAISGSSRAVIPVIRIGDQTVGTGRPGPICGRLLAAYRSYVAGALRTAVE